MGCWGEEQRVPPLRYGMEMPKIAEWKCEESCGTEMGKGCGIVGRLAQVYSYRSASMGLRFAAFHAG